MLLFVLAIALLVISSDDFATHEECPAFVDAVTYGYASDSDLEEADETLEDEESLNAGAEVKKDDDDDADACKLCLSYPFRLSSDITT